VPPVRTPELHRPLRTTTPQLNDILCRREERDVGAQLTFHYDRKQIILEQTETAKGFDGQYVELFDYWDRPLEVRLRGHILPYRVFSKDQRVSHTAIVENKRLGHALAMVKAQQDLRLATKVMTNSEKTGYKKRRGTPVAPVAAYGPTPHISNARRPFSNSACRSSREKIPCMKSVRLSWWARIAVLLFLGATLIAHTSAQQHGSGQLPGHVVDSEGATFKGALVLVHKQGSGEDNLRVAAHTDRSGDFVLPLEEGGYDILVTAPGFAAAVQTIPVAPEQQDECSGT
jgi:hypothetical protein